MQWYEDEAYVSWQNKDGMHTKHLKRAIRYAKRQVEGEDGKPRKSKNDVVAAAVQLNSEYGAWRASMMVERERCILYAQLIAYHSLEVGRKSDEEIDDRLKITASIAERLAGDFRRGKHWKNAWKGDEVEVDQE